VAKKSVSVRRFFPLAAGRPTGLKRGLKNAVGTAERPGAKSPYLSYRSFVGLKPHANPKDQGIDFFASSKAFGFGSRPFSK
jgi:hypothetical protein